MFSLCSNFFGVLECDVVNRRQDPRLGQAFLDDEHETGDVLSDDWFLKIVDCQMSITINLLPRSTRSLSIPRSRLHSESLLNVETPSAFPEDSDTFAAFWVRRARRLG